MEKMTVEQLCGFCGGRLLCGDAGTAVTSVCIDSRKACKGSLFVALPGEKVDGHDYIEASAAAGAACVISQREVTVGGCCTVLVENSLAALQAIAAGYRRQFDFRCVGVTGSVGKTTTKEFIYAVLASKYKTLKTQGNLNSETGMPLMAFELNGEFEAAVFEMGMSRRGEIAELTKVAKPELAVITNIGVSHIEHLGSRENILRAKLEIERGLSRRGIMLLNGDDAMLAPLDGKLKHKTVLYGIDNPAALYRAEYIAQGEHHTEFDLVTPAGRTHARINAVGRHNVLNALAAVTVGLYSGISLEDCAAALLNFENAGMRQRIYDYKGLKIIEDCYNASPDSMKAAFSLLGAMSSRRVAVIADMLELGRYAPEMHRRVGGYAAVGCDLLIAYGSDAKYYVEGAAAAGMDKSRMILCETGAEAGERLMKEVREGDALLFKGSRGMRTEDVLKTLKEEWKR